MSIYGASESSHQEALFSWASYQIGTYPELKYMYHVPNGGKRDIKTARALKREGVKAGVPDIVLPVARGGFYGLYIELKVNNNKPTGKQREYINFLQQQGYKAMVSYGWQEAREIIEEYLKLC